MTCLCCHTVIGECAECRFDTELEVLTCTPLVVYPMQVVEPGEPDEELKKFFQVLEPPQVEDGDLVDARNLEDNMRDLIDHIASLGKPSIWRRAKTTMPDWLFRQVVEVFAWFRDYVALPCGCTLRSVLDRVIVGFSAA